MCYTVYTVNKDIKAHDQGINTINTVKAIKANRVNTVITGCHWVVNRMFVNGASRRVILVIEQGRGVERSEIATMGSADRGGLWGKGSQHEGRLGAVL